MEFKVRGMNIMENKKLTSRNDLKRIEARLQETLRPVTPRRAFVQGLQRRLDEEMEQLEKKDKFKKGLLVAGGAFGGVLMVVALIRSLTSWKKLMETMSAWYARQQKKRQAASA